MSITLDFALAYALMNKDTKAETLKSLCSKPVVGDLEWACLGVLAKEVELLRQELQTLKEKKI